MSIDLSQFIPTFLEESFEGLELMESGLLNLEQGDIDTINAIFRAAHSIKGGAGTFGFNRVTNFTHEVETLLDEMRDGRREVNQSDINLLLKSVDCIKLLIESARDGVECEDDAINETHLALEQTLSGKAHGDNDSQDVSEVEQLLSEVKSKKQWLIEFVPKHEIMQTGNDPLHLLNVLAELGSMSIEPNLQDIPPLGDIHPEECYLYWRLTLVSDCSEEDIIEVFEWVEDECSLTITLSDSDEPSPAIESVEQPSLQVDQTPPSQPPSQVPQKSLKAPDESVKAKPTTEGGSIRVGIDKVDTLINRVGELVITQAMLKQIGSELAEDETVDKLREGLVQLESNTRDLQEDVMRIRMLPISFVFNRFPRMVYDVSSKLGKKVELKLSGEQTELDKTVMEKIGDPLVHLVRNSLDHGLEMPEERKEAGKDETGIVHLNAYHQGGYIVIDIIDDGRGLNTEKIYDKAIEKGLISADQSLSDQEINELIFAPGFSTADAVSDLSGRGVGMDVVRRNIESLGGHVSLSSQQGEGSKFSVSLPLTLAILDGQLINVAGQIFIVPLVSIVESVQVNKSAVKAIAGQENLYLFRDEYLPIYNIRSLFSLPGKVSPADENMVIIVESNGNKYALVVDDLLEQQQVVLKSLESNYMAVEGISGATILGHGGVALIIDIKGVSSLNHKNSRSKKFSRERSVAEATT
ncbi:chemotaxis protein CheA [Psychrobium sp. 1_MG-2023]|uniref:chemotaxis protein CheA n=1 Tax=Psychrobium sp. 1_MG-2023 TaxID=3062624 RepID=UPI000C3246BD|nr:chemotaxis protein CheA [Psychrobium sp. 1_MG-2023]MDP2560147.1 chemotaxis protein CheA [Psychrobium sp. 1_MG-2023]PKF56960.1 chemotaxis protein CheA [Alteromonadales bacterium alter-6D02]